MEATGMWNIPGISWTPGRAYVPPQLLPKSLSVGFVTVITIQLFIMTPAALGGPSGMFIFEGLSGVSFCFFAPTQYERRP